VKILMLTPGTEKSSYGDRYCVTVDFNDSRIKGSLTIGAMASPTHIRYQGTVIINGVSYTASNNCAVDEPKVAHYALSKSETWSDYASTSAIETFRKALVEIIAEVLKDQDFVKEQIATESQYIGYDIERLQANRDALIAQIAELDQEIAQKKAKQWTNKALLV